MLEALNLYRPKVYEFSRLNITYTVRAVLCVWCVFWCDQHGSMTTTPILTIPTCNAMQCNADTGAVEAQAAEAG